MPTVNFSNVMKTFRAVCSAARSALSSQRKRNSSSKFVTRRFSNCSASSSNSKMVVAPQGRYDGLTSVAPNHNVDCEDELSKLSLEQKIQERKLRDDVSKYSFDDVLEIVKRAADDILNLSKKELQSDELIQHSLEQIGIESLVGLQFMGRLKESYGFSVPSLLIWECVSLKDCAERLYRVNCCPIDDSENEPSYSSTQRPQYATGPAVDFDFEELADVKNVNGAPKTLAETVFVVNKIASEVAFTFPQVSDCQFLNLAPAQVDLDAESREVVEFVMRLRQEYDLRVPNELIYECRSLLEFSQRLLSAQAESQSNNFGLVRNQTREVPTAVLHKVRKAVLKVLLETSSLHKSASSSAKKAIEKELYAGKKDSIRLGDLGIDECDASQLHLVLKQKLFQSPPADVPLEMITISALAGLMANAPTVGSARPDAADEGSILYAARTGESLEKFFSNDHDGLITFDMHKYRQQVDKLGNSALSWCAGYGHEKSVLYLLENSVDVESANKEGRTALMWACRNGFDSIVTILIARGSDWQRTTKKGVSCLHFAIWGQHRSTVELLLGLGADLNLVNKAGCNSAIWAATAGGVDFARWLLSLNADFGLVNPWGHGCVVKALWQMNIPMLEWLIDECHSDLNDLRSQLFYTDKAGLSCIDLALSHDDHVTAEWLQRTMERDDCKSHGPIRPAPQIDPDFGDGPR